MTTMWFTFESGVDAPDAVLATAATAIAATPASSAPTARVRNFIRLSPSFADGAKSGRRGVATLRFHAGLPGDAVRVVAAARRERSRRGDRGGPPAPRPGGDRARTVDEGSRPAGRSARARPAGAPGGARGRAGGAGLPPVAARRAGRGAGQPAAGARAG